MPISLENARPVVRITASGPVTHSEIRELFQAMMQNAPRQGGAAVFVDTLGVTGAPSAAELRLIAMELKRLTDAGFGPIAVVTGSEWMYGVVRMFSVFVKSTEVAAFRSAEDAETWLSLDGSSGPGDSSAS